MRQFAQNRSSRAMQESSRSRPKSLISERLVSASSSGARRSRAKTGGGAREAGRSPTASGVAVDRISIATRAVASLILASSRVASSKSPWPRELRIAVENGVAAEPAPIMSARTNFTEGANQRRHKIETTHRQRGTQGEQDDESQYASVLAPARQWQPSRISLRNRVRFNRAGAEV